MEVHDCTSGRDHAQCAEQNFADEFGIQEGGEEMTKDEVLNFLQTASTADFSEIRQRMTKIIQEREFQEYLKKQEQRYARIEKIVELRESGLSFGQIANLYNLSSGRIQQIYSRHLRYRKIETMGAV